MKTCRQRQFHLKGYVDGELPISDRLAMWWHLLRCPNCREARATMEEISRRLASGEPQSLDPNLRERILAGVTYTDEPRPAGVPPVRWRSAFPLALGTAATIVIVAIVVQRSPVTKNELHALVSSSSAAPTAEPAASLPAQARGAAPPSSLMSNSRYQEPTPAPSPRKDQPQPEEAPGAAKSSGGRSNVEAMSKQEAPRPGAERAPASATDGPAAFAGSPSSVLGPENPRAASPVSSGYAKTDSAGRASSARPAARSRSGKPAVAARKTRDTSARSGSAARARAGSSNPARARAGSGGASRAKAAGPPAMGSGKSP